MQLGICVRDAPAAEVARLGRFAEDHGFSHVFVPDLRGGGAPGAPLAGRDAFVSLAALFEATSTVIGGVGVAAVIFHDATALARAAGTLTEQSDGRFVLGIGVSHPEAASRGGGTYPSSPLKEMRGWVTDMRRYAEGGLAFGGGFPILVGALRPRMVALGASEADGVVLNWLTPEHARGTVAAVRQAAGGSTATTVLYVRVSPAEAVRADAVSYDALANYHQHFVDQGLTSPEAIIAGTCLPADDPAAARDRLAQYADAGIDVLCLYPHGFAEAERERVLGSLVG